MENLNVPAHANAEPRKYRKYRFIENRHAMEQVACTMAVYTRLKGTYPDAWANELRDRRAALRSWRIRWNECGNLPCGYQDHIGENLSHAASSFYATLNAMRLLRGRVPPSFQDTIACALGEI